MKKEIALITRGPDLKRLIRSHTNTSIMLTRSGIWNTIGGRSFNEETGVGAMSFTITMDVSNDILINTLTDYLGFSLEFIHVKDPADPARLNKMKE